MNMMHACMLLLLLPLLLDGNVVNSGYELHRQHDA